MNLRKELCLFCADPVFSYEEVPNARRGSFVVRSCSKVKFEELLTFAARILKRQSFSTKRKAMKISSISSKAFGQRYSFCSLASVHHHRRFYIKLWRCEWGTWSINMSKLVPLVCAVKFPSPYLPDAMACVGSGEVLTRHMSFPMGGSIDHCDFLDGGPLEFYCR